MLVFASYGYASLQSSDKLDEKLLYTKLVYALIWCSTVVHLN